MAVGCRALFQLVVLVENALLGTTCVDVRGGGRESRLLFCIEESNQMGVTPECAYAMEVVEWWSSGCRAVGTIHDAT